MDWKHKRTRLMWELLNKGYSTKEISKIFRVREKSVNRLLKLYGLDFKPGKPKTLTWKDYKGRR